VSDLPDMPDMDALIRDGERSESKRYLWLGCILLGGGVALLLGSRALFAGQMTLLAPATMVIGALFIARSFISRAAGR
jgi:hypothetical protein